MNIEALVTRIGDLSRGIEQSAANHNYLLGSLAEAKLLLSKLQTEAEDAPAVADDIATVASDVCQVSAAIEAV